MVYPELRKRWPMTSNEHVERAQKLLHAKNPDCTIKVDAIFGRDTEKAVRDFQERSNLPVTGVINDATWKALETE